MKKTFKKLALMLLASYAFSSCVDVPEPYNLPTKGNTTVIEPTGDGTSASPYNVAAIVEKILEMEAGVESTETYYIKGKVSSVTTDKETIEKYGNHTFDMIDEGGNKSTVFTAYQVYGPGKKKFTSVDDIKVGDIVVVCGRVVNYKGSKPETVGKGEAYVVSINDSEEGNSDGTEDDGTQITCTQAAEIANTLQNNVPSTQTYTVTGYITSVVSKVSNNQQTFWMADEKGGGNVFEAYWANLPEGVTQFLAGTRVQITGNLIKYVNLSDGTVIPEIKNATVVILDDDGGDTPAADGIAVTCAEAVELTNALANNGSSTDKYTVTGYITSIVSTVSSNQQSFWMADEKGGTGIFEAYWANLPSGVTEFKTGMKVKITGKLTKYIDTKNDNAVICEIKNAVVEIIENSDGDDTTAADAIPVTCAEAVRLTMALTDGGTSAETYAVTGYITETDGKVSYNQQTFWMADEEGGTGIFEAYWANLPAGVSVFTVGMKVTITGKLTKYIDTKNDNTVICEIKNATVVVLEHGDGGNGGSGGDINPTPEPGGDPVTDLVGGDFEEWVSDTQPMGWLASGSAAPGNAVISKSSEALSGNHACLVGAPGSANKRLATQTITLEAGSYTFSFYAKSTTPEPCQTRGGYAAFVNGAVPSNGYHYASFTDINNNGWTLVSYDFELTATTELSLLVMNPKNSSYSTSQDILVDDATLVKK